MITVTAQPDFQALAKTLGPVAEKQIPFATAMALTALAYEVRDEELATMRQVFDKPTPTTMRSLYVKRADRKGQPIQARVWFKDSFYSGIPADRYLQAQVMGGTRRDKRSEKLLKAKGLMRPDEQWVPGKGAPINQYGNITGSRMNKILSSVQAQLDRYQNSTDKTKKDRFFAGRPRNGNGPRGVWERKGKRIRPIMIFVKQFSYSARFDFFGIAEQVMTKRHAPIMWREFNKAMATARR